MNTKLVIGSDHAGFALKEKVKAYISTHFEFELTDVGTDSEESTDYPNYAHAAAAVILGDVEHTFGILICGSGNGISIAANKHKHIRAALCWNEDIAELARLHNNANILSLPARFVSEELALKIVNKFFSTSFEGGRHAARVDKISCI